MLPFPRAHFYVAAFLIVTLAAFAPSYFLVLPGAPFAHHLHGLTATAWIVLVATQSWSIHQGRWKVHAWSGRSSLLLVPLFLAGGLLVTDVTLESTRPFKTLFGTALAFADVVATVAFALLVWLALRYRKTPDLHGRYMLATVTLLIGPSVARLFANFVPGFLIRAPEDLPKFGNAVDASFILAAGLLLLLVVKDASARKPVLPFFFAFLANMAMWLGYKWFGYTDVWIAASARFAALPGWAHAGLGLVLGVGVIALGWTRPAEPIALHAAPARATRGALPTG